MLFDSIIIPTGSVSSNSPLLVASSKGKEKRVDQSAKLSDDEHHQYVNMDIDDFATT